MDIKSDIPGPASQLSNFAPHAFEFRGVPCGSMEGLLQSLKFPDPAEQRAVCLLVGKDAKEKGMTQDWRPSQTLWWQGMPMKRDSPIYQSFLDDAFNALFSQNRTARTALLATGEEDLTHSIGLADATQTVLTEQEFCERLAQIRQTLLPPSL